MEREATRAATAQVTTRPPTTKAPHYSDLAGIDRSAKACGVRTRGAVIRSSRAVLAVTLAALTVLAGVALVAVSGSVAGAERVLVVTDADSGERLAAIPVESGSTITLAYTHSVEKTPVRDVYRVEGERLVNDRMVFHSYGAGLPANQPVERTDDGAFVVTPNRSYERLAVSPGERAGHELIVDGDRRDLVALADGADVVLGVERRESGLPALGAVVAGETAPHVAAAGPVAPSARSAHPDRSAPFATSGSTPPSEREQAHRLTSVRPPFRLPSKA
jgi:hypothetical protein